MTCLRTLILLTSTFVFSTALLSTHASAVPQISVSNVTVKEDAGTAITSVKLSHRSLRTIRVDYNSRADSAIAGEDFQGKLGTLEFQPGQISRDIEFKLYDDDHVEATEKFFIKIKNPRNAYITSNTATVRIEDNDSVPPDTTATLVTYPVTNEMKQRFESHRFRVRVSPAAATGQPDQSTQSFVYESKNSFDPTSPLTLQFMQAANHWTTFSFSGAMKVSVERIDGNAIESCVVRPMKHDIQPEISNNACIFTIDEPAKLSVEIDENTFVEETFGDVYGSNPIKKHVIKNPLFIFAEKLETDIPDKSASNVIYFEPGIHNIGKSNLLQDGSHVYISGGAYVIGTFKYADDTPTNISITGRGILSAIDLTETDAEYNSWANQAIDFSTSKGGGLLIEGITLTDPLRSCVVSYSPITIRDVKLFSWSHRNDGITGGAGSLIEDNFIKVQDDNIKLYYGDQTIRNNVIWQQTAGAVFKFAWNLPRVAENNHVYDIDVIHSDVFYDHSKFEEDRPEFSGTSAIFASNGYQADSATRNTSFKDIRIEEEYLLRLMNLRMVTMHAKPGEDPVYWGDPDPGASKLIDNIVFENISIAGVPYIASTLYGNDGGIIRNLHFKNLSVAGELIDWEEKLRSRNEWIGLETAGAVSNIVFTK